MKIMENVSSYEDFKYVMQDSSYLYLGAKYSYEELLKAEMAPFKLKAILNHYILKEAAPDTTLESQFYYLEKGSFLYETFLQLKIRVKVQVKRETKSLFGKKRTGYTEKILSLQELTDLTPAQKREQEMVIREIVLSKLGMMTFSV